MSRELDPDIRGNLRLATTMYIAALLIIASLVIGTHVIIDDLVRQQEKAAHLISMSGRQRMLSQWIVKTSLQVATAPDPAAREEAAAETRKLVELMAESHEALVSDLQAVDRSTREGAALHRVYYDDPYHLDAKVRSYLDLSKSLLGIPPAELTRSNPILKQMESATKGPIIDALNEVVLKYQEGNEATIHTLRRVLAGLMALMLLTLVAEALFIFRPLFRRLAITQEALFRAATTDGLTSCMNRAYFLTVAGRELDRIKRYGKPMTLLLLDIDKFKAINDTFGHAVGDDAIRQVASVATRTLRMTDSLARIGGEEFAIILPETRLDTGMAVAEKLRERIAATSIPLPDGRTYRMTVSIGATVPTDGDDAIFAALARADKALYRAKHLGRNRVITLDHAMAEPVP